MAPTDKDFAEFARLGLQFRLLTLAQIQSWADGVIAERVDTPAWAIQLSMADLKDMISSLNSVPGEVSEGLPTKMIVGLAHRKWKTRCLSLRQAVEIVFELDLNGRLPDTESRAGDHWGSVLYCEYEEFQNGYRTEAKMRASIDEMLADYAKYEEVVPAWA